MFLYSNFCTQSDAPRSYAGSDTPEWLTWKTRVRNTVRKLASKDSPSHKLVAIAFTVITEGNGPPEFKKAKSLFLKALETAKAALVDDVYGELHKPESESSSPNLSNRIFIVHGHDSGLKIDAERFIRELGLEPVVLHRQPDEGATIIEKFEKNSDVGYAFILLTPDEIAYTADQINIDEHMRRTESRARPNVIFEFGFFVGKLGRDKVCCLHKKGVVFPSDLDGLVYKEIDQSIEEQAYPIIRELKAAGYNITV